MEGRYLSLSLFIYSNKGLFLIVSLISLTSWRVFIIISNLSHDLQVHGLMLLNAPPIWWFVKNISSILLSTLQTRSARGRVRVVPYPNTWKIFAWKKISYRFLNFQNTERGFFTIFDSVEPGKWKVQDKLVLLSDLKHGLTVML